MARLKLQSYGRECEIAFSIQKYQNGNMAIQMMSYEVEYYDTGNHGYCKDEYYEPWCTLTVNLSKECKPNCAFIDVNNNGSNIVNWLEQNKLGHQTDNLGISGFCIYPEFEFDMDELKKYTI